MFFEEGAPIWYSLKETKQTNNSNNYNDVPAFIEGTITKIIDKSKCEFKLQNKPSQQIINIINERQQHPNSMKPSSSSININNNPTSIPQQQQSNLTIITDNINLEHRYDKEENDYSKIDDLVKLPCLNEPELLKAISERYLQDKVFSYVGPTLIVVNPYKKMDQLFSLEMQEYYSDLLKQNVDIYSQQPHIFGIAAYCMQSILQNDTPKQAIVISGESGAGKTENTKYAMKFLTYMNSPQLQNLSQSSFTNLRDSQISHRQSISIKQQQQKVSIEQRILNCNPILEAFGNAKTTRNDNSSRFGKLVILHLKEDPHSLIGKEQKSKLKKMIISSASLTNYLLEKSRIVQISNNERNYHIFYHLLKGATPQFLQNIGLTNNIASYRYLQSECVNVDTINDEQLYNEVIQSLQDQQFNDQEQKAIWNIVSVVLLLGNIDFEKIEQSQDEGGCQISSKNKYEVEQIIKKLSCTEKDFIDALTTKKRSVNNNVTISPLTISESIDNRDSFSKYLYEKLFNWIVFRLNQSITDSDEYDSATLHPFTPNINNNSNNLKRQSISQSKRRQIEILDIFGFEMFEKNSFEQLCINFSNEKLQQLYISYIYEGERDLFIKQNLKDYLTEIKYSDNKGIIESLDKTKDPIGIFNLVDDSSSLSTGTDAALIAKIKKEHEQNNHQNVSFSQQQQLIFRIHHSAGSIDYNITNFRVKNKDEVSLALQNLTQQKNIKSILSLGSLDNMNNNNNNPMSSKVSEKFLGSKFRQQMKKLMEELGSCECQFVRCIKPNAIKKSGIFQTRYSLNQINCLGVLETIRVRKQGYVYRAEYIRFYKDNWQLYPPNFNEIHADVTNMFNKINNYQELVIKQ